MKGRHLADVTDTEWYTLHDMLIQWLIKHDVAGSVARDYSLYNALDDERKGAKGRRAARREKSTP